GNFVAKPAVPAVEIDALRGKAGHADVLQRGPFIVEENRRNRLPEEVLRSEPLGAVKHAPALGARQFFVGPHRWPHPRYSALAIRKHISLRIANHDEWLISLVMRIPTEKHNRMASNDFKSSPYR